MRDSQKSKLYAAERGCGIHVHKHQVEMSIADCQRFVDKMLASAYVQRKYKRLPRSGITVVAGRNGGYATSRFGRAEIHLGVWARQPLIIIHELSHHLAGFGCGHGWQFAEIMLDLTRHFLGAEAADKLKASYKEHKVRHRAPVKRPISDERRAQLVTQLAAAREAKREAAARAAGAVAAAKAADQPPPV